MPSAIRHSALAALAAALIVQISFAAAAPEPTSPTTSASALEDDMSIGRSNAPVTLIEYGSDTCPHCARFAKEVLPAIKKAYVDTGLVRYVFREFPTAPEDLASAGFLVARCAGPNRYFDVLQALFEAQSTAKTGRDFLLAGASAGGLDEARMTACVSDPKAIDALNARVAAAIAKEKIDATPTFIVNGRKLVDGEKSFADIKAAIDPLLTAQRAKQP